MGALPNMISIVRIILSVILLKLEPLTGIFWTVYICCGVSDMLDGYIARKINVASELGAKLDSIADFIMVVIVIMIFYPIAKPAYQILFWVVGIAAIRLLALLIGYIKFSQLAMLHTYGNKLMGILLFLLPFGAMLLSWDLLIYIICMIATIVSLELLVLQISMKHLDLNKKGIWIRTKEEVE